MSSILWLFCFGYLSKEGPRGLKQLRVHLIQFPNRIKQLWPNGDRARLNLATPLRGQCDPCLILSPARYHKWAVFTVRWTHLNFGPEMPSHTRASTSICVLCMCQIPPNAIKLRFQINYSKGWCVVTIVSQNIIYVCCYINKYEVSKGNSECRSLISRARASRAGGREIDSWSS